MVNPQLEDGYTKIADEILEQMAKVKLSPTQYKIIFAVWRYTYGFNRKEHHLSISFLAKATECDERAVRRGLRQMLDREILLERGVKGQTRVLEFNKRFSEWREDNSNLSRPDKTNLSREDSLDRGQVRPEDSTDLSRPDSTDLSRPDSLDPQDKQYTNDIDHTLADEIQNVYFNTFGTILTRHNFDVINSYLKDGMTIWHIQEALRRTSENNKRSFRYTMGILNNWISQAAFTQKDVENLDKLRHPRRDNRPITADDYTYNEPTKQDLSQFSFLDDGDG